MMSMIEPDEGRPGANGTDHRRRRLVGIEVAAALVAGGLAWWLGERLADAYRSDLLPRLKISPSVQDIARLKAAQVGIAWTTYATTGGLLGLALGAAGGLHRGPRAFSHGTQLGAVVGALAGGGLAAIVTPLFYHWRDPQSTDLIGPLLTHAAIWSTIGAAAGLAYGVGSGAGRRSLGAMAGGLVGGLVAATLYEIVGAIALPTSRTDLPVSTSSSARATAQILLALLTAVGSTIGLAKGETRPIATTGPAATGGELDQ